jgi:hypothetical protein
VSESKADAPVDIDPDSDDQLRREALLAELANWSDGFWRNEEGGERRLQFFITLLTAVMSGLVAFHQFLSGDKSPGAPDPDRIVVLVARPALAGLLVIGVVTFMRLVRRHHVTDEYKERAARVREYVFGSRLCSWFYPSGRRLKSFVKDYPRKSTWTNRTLGWVRFLEIPGIRSIWNGGLSTTMLALNCMIAALLFGLSGGPGLSMAPSRAIVVTILAAVLQLAFQRWRDAVASADDDDRVRYRRAHGPRQKA